MAEVLTVNYDNSLTFNFIYSYIGTYRDKVYISANDIIYEFDVTNRILTPIYAKPPSFKGNIVGGGIYNGIIYLFRGRTDVDDASGGTDAYIDSYNIDAGVYSNIKVYGQYGAFLCKPWVVGDTICACSTVYVGFRTNLQESDFYSFNMSTQELVKNLEVKGAYGSYKNEQIIDGYFQYSVIGYYSKYSKDYNVTQKAYRMGMMRMVNNNSTVIIDNVSYQNTASGSLSNPFSDSMLASGKFKKDNLLYMIGGTDENEQYFNTIRVFNIDTGLFSEVGNIKYNFYGRDVCEFNGNYYVLTNNGLIIISFIDYDLTYKIANKNGEQEYTQLTGQSPITQVRFNYYGTGDVGFAFNTLSGTVTGTYTPNIPSGYKLVGFGTEPNSKIALAGLNMDVAVTIGENFTFYEIYQVYKPPATTFEMDLYQNTAENNRVDKTNYLTSVGSIFGALRSECSIIRPSIIIEHETLPTFNYVYIGAFGRYYFVTGITSVAYRMWRIELNTDVLMTYKNGIALLTAIIARQENDYNDDLIDTEIPTEKEPTVTYQEIPNTVLTTQEDGDMHDFVLTVIGA